ncbi:hypothetical protein AA18889_0315 [Acetobacter senegalensis DSM 18889]|nr:hypothetical protein AA18889_0315 [Acetobacter senegalensis DSM 18889]
MRMSDAEIGIYLIRARLSLPDKNGRYQVAREDRKRNILNVGKAVAQLWRDLEEEERVGVERKVLA